MSIDKGSGEPSESRADPPPGGLDPPAADPAAGSPIGFRLDPGSGVPTYRQLVHQVEQGLRLGYLAEGDQLPTVKDTVSSLAINPNTVLKAYRELEQRGLTVGRPGQGTFIAGTLRRADPGEQEALRASLADWLQAAGEAGLDGDGIGALFATELRSFLDRHDEPGPRRGATRRPGRHRPSVRRSAGEVA